MPFFLIVKTRNPTRINFVNGTSIQYLYNATGQKVRKAVKEGITTTQTDYMGGFQYKNTVLQFFPHAEGYCKPNGVQFDYVYSYKDYLGNVRLSFEDKDKNGVLGNEEIVSCGPPDRRGFANCISFFTTAIVDENHYYPFGLQHEGYDYLNEAVYKYKYNGKELEDELGKNTYAYGWRDYDPAIGRFNKMDRFSEKYYDMTPYQYGANSPVVFNDIKGDSIVIHSKEDNDRILYINGNLYSKDRKTNKWVAYSGKNLKTDENGKTSIGGFLGQVVAALDQIGNGGEGGCQLITDLENASHFIGIKEDTENTGGATSITWNPNEMRSGPDVNGNTIRPSFIGLAHELGHTHDLLDGKYLDEQMQGAPEGIRNWEIQAMEWENKVRLENNIPLRASYGVGYGKAIFKIVTPTIELRMGSDVIEQHITGQRTSVLPIN